MKIPVLEMLYSLFEEEVFGEESLLIEKDAFWMAGEGGEVVEESRLEGVFEVLLIHKSKVEVFGGVEP